jgi:hypothetical protein
LARAAASAGYRQVEQDQFFLTIYMGDTNDYSFRNQARQAQASLDEEIMFDWVTADIMEQPDTPENRLLKELVRRNKALEQQMKVQQERHQSVLN